VVGKKTANNFTGLLRLLEHLGTVS